MTLVIVGILLLTYVLIATGNMTGINKAAIAIFAGTLGWVLLPHQSAFVGYLARASEVVLFLLATMTIVEILDNNGCFDFIRQLLKTRNSRKMLWALATVTFLISANLDNLTTTVMMLTMMHGVVPDRRHRFVYGSAIVIAANCGGALTVIGNPEGLVLWNMGAVTASNFSFSLMIPCLIAWALPTWWIGRMLPERVDTQWITMPYRGDDTRLKNWQRLMMLVVGIGGLWFIPTFHNLTSLSPFLGALCVLSILWIVNEIVNRKLMQAEQMAQRRMPRVLQYGVIQMMLFVLGMMMIIGVVEETGAISVFAKQIDEHVSNIWLTSIITGTISSVLDNFATAMSMFTLHSLQDCPMNSEYWKLIAFSAAIGGNTLCVGSVSGLALMKMERMPLLWYFNHVGWKSLVAWLIGVFVLYFTV